MKKYLLLILASIGVVAIIGYVLPYILSGFNEPIEMNIPGVAFLPPIILVSSFFILKRLMLRFGHRINIHIIISWVLVLLTYFILHFIEEYVTKSYVLTYTILDYLGWDFNTYKDEFESRMRGKVFILIPFLYLVYSVLLILIQLVRKSLKKR